MRARITVKQLENLVKRLNILTDSPMETWARDENGKLKSNIGNFHLSGAYGKHCVHRIMNEGGGVDTPIISYHVSKRELFEKMNSFIDGLKFSNINRRESNE